MNSPKSNQSSQDTSLNTANAPQTSRFQKGQSGNLKGRPKGSGKSKTNALDFATNQQVSNQDHKTTPFDAQVLDEANRVVTLRENGQEIELNVGKAILRSLSVGALKGDLKSQLAFTSMTQTAKAKKEAEWQMYFDKAVEYKINYPAQMQFFKEHRFTPPFYLPHPDDTYLDIGAMSMSFNGPMTLKEDQLWTASLELQRLERLKVKSYEKTIKTLKRKKDPNFASKIEQFEYMSQLGTIMADLLEMHYPSVEIRRQPAFNIEHFRKTHPVRAKIATYIAAQKSKGLKWCSITIDELEQTFNLYLKRMDDLPATGTAKGWLLKG